MLRQDATGCGSWRQLTAAVITRQQQQYQTNISQLTARMTSAAAFWKAVGSSRWVGMPARQHQVGYILGDSLSSQ
jgi:hypothetical protein